MAAGNQVSDSAVDDLTAVTADLLAADGQEVCGWHPVTGEVTVHVGGRVTRATGVHDQDFAACPRQHKGRGKPGGAASDDDDVVVIHVFKAGDTQPDYLPTLLFLKKPGQMSLMDDVAAVRIAATFEQVGPRLKRLRTQRGMTLTGVATSTGISKSTLSRLETGQRRRPWICAHPFPCLSGALNDLVGAPEEAIPVCS